MVVDHLFVKTRNLVYFIIFVDSKPFRALLGDYGEEFFILIELTGAVRINNAV
jgi:hypothetical protein